MSHELPSAGSRFVLLERVTAGVLLLVVAALGWVLVASYWPEAADLASAEVLVIALLVLLTVALVLVSVVALIHTSQPSERDRGEPRV